MKEGDMVTLGNHKLLCGDALNYSNVTKLLAGNKARMLFTDPPYNINYKPEETHRKHGKGGRTVNPLGGIIGDINFDYPKFLKLLELGFIEGAIYICGTTSTYLPIYEWMTRTFGREPIVIVWGKNNFSLGMRHYHRQHEFIFYNYFPNNVWNGGRNQVDVWNIALRPVNDYVHPTQKPIRMAKKAILNSSNENEIVLDLFGGSGTTLIAAEMTKRRCYMIEIDPKYCEVIVKRWEAFTGQAAETEELYSNPNPE